MPRKIRVAERVLKPLKDIGLSHARLAPQDVAAALGAEQLSETLAEQLGPLSLFNVRNELLARLQSRGGRPGLSGITRRIKIPVSDEDWDQLEELASDVSSPGFTPSAGQIASVLLSTAIQVVTNKNR